MAGSGHSPLRYSRLDPTGPDDDDDDDDAILASPGLAGSPNYRDSPWSAGASASPTSTTLLSLAGAAAGTPLSSLDGDGPDKMENESLLTWSRSQKGEAPPAASVASAPRSPAMAQSPERNRGLPAPQAQQNTRLAKPDPTTTSIPPLVRLSFASAPPPPEAPAIVRTTSSHGDLPLRHPVPDPNPSARAGALVSNVAHLEASAEQLAQFDSIEDAIREAHQELKRSDSRRSSLLAASVRRANSTRAPSEATDPDVPATPATTSSHRPPRPQLLRAYSGHDSIIELNSAARSGGFSPNDYIMSPASSIAGSILQRSTSNGSASGSVHGSTNGHVANLLGITESSITAATAAGDDYFPFLSRHGTGKSSMRSVRSGKLSLPEIAELEPPTTLTQAALDEADRVLAADLPHDEEDPTLRLASHPDSLPQEQPLPPLDAAADLSWALPLPLQTHNQPASESYTTPQQAVHDDRGLQMGQDPGDEHAAGGQYDRAGQNRPVRSASVTTYEQAQRAFHDFDGVHCDPDESEDQVPELLQYGEQAMPQPMKRAVPKQAPPRPKSYMDPATGRQMLYYPARVPAMLQLPAKLSKSSKGAERRSQVMSMMVQAKQESTAPKQRQSWLPDLSTGSDIGSLPYNHSVPDGLSSPSHSASHHEFYGAADGSLRGEGDLGADIPGEESMRDSGLHSQSMMNLRRPSRLLDADKRKSRMATALDKLPPQLRASAYFDLPTANATATIEAKNGSAMDTLDSILDAAAHAPISAFTDHAFAGHLGAEVYGVPKKRNRKKANSMTLAQLTGAAEDAEKSESRQLRASRSRSSFFGLRKVSSVDGHDDTASRGRIVSSNGKLQKRRSSQNMLDSDGALTPGLSDGGLMAPDDDERLSDDEDEECQVRRSLQPGEEEDEVGEDDEDEDNLVLGAPTTLLAELQLRKQQQKQRTRPITSAFPNGMHSTLLELDAVAEVERKTRRVKKVNLAWEDPIGAHEDEDEADDEDVPLGLLYAAKAAGHNDMAAAGAELSRPLGLMEKKELEDNEPLSRRRDRLQGRDAGAVSMYLGGNNAFKRHSVLALKPISPVNGSQLTPESEKVAGDAVSNTSDNDDEPLAVRRNRVKARRESELPPARPVSTSFSAELLSQFGDLDTDNKDDKDSAKQGKASNTPEEEETLGQRRRRLQAEKEAREQEMTGGGSGGNSGSGGLAVNDQALHALTGSSRLSRRLSMADLLSAAPAGPAKNGHPSGARRDSRVPSSRTMTMQADPRRGAHGQQQYGAMGLMGSASAAHLPSMGGRGHMGMNSMGTHNGMMGGGVSPYGGVGMIGMGSTMSLNNNRNPYGNAMAGGYAAGYNNNGYGMPMQMPVQMGMPMQQMQPMPMQMGMQMPMGMQRPMMPMQMNMNMGMSMGMGMGAMQPPQVQIDRVERWRQGVYP